MTALGEGLRPLGAYGSQEGQVGPSTTPARRFCPNTDRPDYLWWGHHCRQDANLQRRYGITCDDYWGLFERQGGRCAICRRPPGTGRRLVVDHDHDSGAIDGLCHFGCNRRLSTSLRRYLTDPPGRAAGLVVPAAKLAAIAAADKAKRDRRRKDGQPPRQDSPLDDYDAKTRRALAQTATKQGA